MYYAHGKLLLTSEYAVLDGAKALAIPTRFGQKMTVKKTRKSDIYWKSYDQDQKEWFTAQISLYDFSAIKTSDKAKAAKLEKLLKGAVRQNSEFLSQWNGFDVKTKLEFPLDWGMGSSSTLIHLVAQWADINPLLLHFEVSQGSGYDVACAGADYPITYQLSEDSVSYTEVDFDPAFKDKLYFVHLNQKQSSKQAIEMYRNKAAKKKTLASKLSSITEEMLNCSSFQAFCEMIDEHEALIAEHLKIQRIRDSHFHDFPGTVKSLGAWGGDFILAACNNSKEEVNSYFSRKGFATILPYDKLIYESAVLTPAWE